MYEKEVKELLERIKFNKKMIKNYEEIMKRKDFMINNDFRFEIFKLKIENKEYHKDLKFYSSLRKERSEKTFIKGGNQSEVGEKKVYLNHLKDWKNESKINEEDLERETEEGVDRWRERDIQEENRE